MSQNPYEPPRSDPRGSTVQRTLSQTTWTGTERTWQINGAERGHLIQLRHSFWTGRASIQVDGEVIYYRAHKLIDFGLKYSFVVDRTACTVCVRSLGLDFRYELRVEEAGSVVQADAASSPNW